MGIGNYLVKEFNNRCFMNNIKPLWDCFTNNIGSMNLAKSAGFQKKGKPYKFYTIPGKEFEK